MASEKTPLIINNPSADSLVGSGPPTPTNNVVHGSSDSQPTVYFLERRPSDVSHHTSSHRQNTDAEEIETIPEGSRIEEFQPRPVSAGSLAGSSKSPSHRSSHKSWLDFFKNVNKKSHAFAGNKILLEYSCYILYMLFSQIYFKYYICYSHKYITPTFIQPLVVPHQ